MKFNLVVVMILISGKLIGQANETAELHLDDLKYIYEHSYNESILHLAKKKGNWSVNGDEKFHMWVTNTGNKISIGQSIKDDENSFVALFLSAPPTFISVGRVILDEVFKSDMKEEISVRPTSFSNEKYKIVFQDMGDQVAITFAKKKYFIANPHH